MIKKIVIKGAKEHNLRNISLDIPKDKFVVITGLSGSGKSSLAFDTIYAEGQRRYVESLSAYARQFLDKMKNINFEKDYFYLFNIRDPKKRYLSNYYRNKDLSFKENQSFLTLENFLKLRLSQNADNYYTRYLSGETINDDSKKVDQRIYNKAVENLKKITFFFVLEKSEQSFRELSKKLNIKFPFSNFFTLHKNKVSGSQFPETSNDEKKLLDQLTFYDEQIYQKILKINLN